MTDRPTFPEGDGPDRDRLSTRTLVLDLALVEDQLRSLATRRAQSGPTPHRTALNDQLEAHEREILQALHRRDLSFRAVLTGALTRGEPVGRRETW